jgi:hypothetical protein
MKHRFLGSALYPQSLAMCLIFAQVGEAGAADWNAGFIRQTLMAKPLPTKVGVPC